MASKKKHEGPSFGPPSRPMQMFLKVDGAKMPALEFRPADEDAHPANMVLLPGAVVDTDSDSTGENFAWEVAGKVANLCRSGHEVQSKAGQRNALCEHLSYAYSILCDYLRETEGDWLISKETAETLIRAAVERIEWAGKCVDFALDNYRTKDC